MRNPKRLLVAAVTIAGLTGGAMVAHADPFRTRAYEASAGTGFVTQNLASATPEWPSLPSTCTIEQRDADTCSVSLVAGVGQADITDGGSVTSVPFWGFGVNGADPALPGAVGSVIKVPQGTVIHVELTQQAGTGSPIDLTFPSLATVTRTGPTSYEVTADRVGTMVFEPGVASSTTGLDAPRQIAMGLVGVLVVTPATVSTPEIPPANPGDPVTPAVTGVDCTSCAYDINAPYDDEALVALGTIDLDFANSNGEGDLSYFGQPRDAQGNTRKVFHLINGKSFPDTDVIDVREGDQLLLRYVNAGPADFNMGLLGLRQSVLGANAGEYTDRQLLVAPRVGPGETIDAAVSIPTGVAEGQKYSLVDQGLGLNGATAKGFGGALTFVDVWTGVAPTIDAPTFDLGTSTISTTAHPSPGHAITGYQTLVTDTDVAPADADWPTDATLFGSAPGVDTPAPIAAVVTAATGKFVWVRAQQDTGAWTPAVSAKVAALPTVTIDSIATSSDRTVTFTATALDGTITLVQAGFGDASAPTDWSATVTDGPTADSHVVLGTDHHGEEVWVRATDSNGNVSVVKHQLVPLDTPTVSGLAYDLGTTTLTGVGTIDAAPAASPATVQWAIGVDAPADNTGWTAGAGSATAISETVPAVDGDLIWVRVVDATGNASTPVSITAATAP